MSARNINRNDPQNQSRDENAEANAGGNTGDAGGTTDRSTSRNVAQSGTSSDRERNLETAREGRRDIGGRELTQRPFFAPVFGGPGALLASPFAVVRRMFEDMDRLVADFGLGRDVEVGSARGLPRGVWSPQVEVFERGNNIVVRADLPGLNRDHVQVEVEDDVLVIRGERREERETTEGKLYRSERSYGSFYRAIPLPENTDSSAVQASFKDGVLEVLLPKPRETGRAPRKVEIK
jgi:HSP20 family protein